MTAYFFSTVPWLQPFRRRSRREWTWFVHSMFGFTYNMRCKALTYIVVFLHKWLLSFFQQFLGANHFTDALTVSNKTWFVYWIKSWSLASTKISKSTWNNFRLNSFFCKCYFHSTLGPTLSPSLAPWVAWLFNWWAYKASVIFGLIHFSLVRFFLFSQNNQPDCKSNQEAYKEPYQEAYRVSPTL